MGLAKYKAAASARRGGAREGAAAAAAVVVPAPASIPATAAQQGPTPASPSTTRASSPGTPDLATAGATTSSSPTAHSCPQLLGAQLRAQLSHHLHLIETRMQAELERLPVHLLDLPLAECVRLHGWDWLPAGFARPPTRPPTTAPDVAPIAAAEDGKAEDPGDKENAPMPSRKGATAKAKGGRQKRVTIVTDCRDRQGGGEAVASARAQSHPPANPTTASSNRRMTRARSMACALPPDQVGAVPPSTIARKRKATTKQSLALHPQLPPTPRVSRARLMAAMRAEATEEDGEEEEGMRHVAGPSVARRITLRADLDAPERAGIQLALEDGTSLSKDSLKSMAPAERRLFLEQVAAMQSQLSSFCAALAAEED